MKFLYAVDDSESSSYFITEECLAELEYRPHGEGQVDEVDVLVSHGQVLVADGEDLGALLGCPDAQVCQSQSSAVEYVAEASHLVLLLLQQRLETRVADNISKIRNTVPVD